METLYMYNYFDCKTVRNGDKKICKIYYHNFPFSSDTVTYDANMSTEDVRYLFRERLSILLQDRIYFKDIPTKPYQCLPHKIYRIDDEMRIYIKSKNRDKISCICVSKNCKHSTICFAIDIEKHLLYNTNRCSMILI